MKRNELKILTTIDRLVVLLAESNDIFFEERKFLVDETKPRVINLSERRFENEIKTKKTIESICKDLGQEVPGKAFKPTQERIF